MTNPTNVNNIISFISFGGIIDSGTATPLAKISCLGRLKVFSFNPMTTIWPLPSVKEYSLGKIKYLSPFSRLTSETILL